MESMTKNIELPGDYQADSQLNNHKFWRNRGESLASLGNYSESLVSFDCALAIQPDDYMTWIKRGGVLTYLDRYAEAIVSFEQAIKIKPNDKTAFLFKGMALHHLGYYKQAYRCYQKVLDKQQPSSLSRLIEMLKKWVYLPKLSQIVN
jgi:tetratricopeptide (TPR) repeat protein